MPVGRQWLWCGVEHALLALLLCDRYHLLAPCATALIVTRSNFRGKGARLLTVLPIITPPFVVGLSLIMLFGHPVVNQFLE